MQNPVRPGSGRRSDIFYRLFGRDSHFFESIFGYGVTYTQGRGVTCETVPAIAARTYRVRPNDVGRLHQGTADQYQPPAIRALLRAVLRGSTHTETSAKPQGAQPDRLELSLRSSGQQSA